MSHGGPLLYRCANCGCPVLDHAVDDEERRECTQCECRQYLGVAHRHADTWLLNLSAGFALAGLAAALVNVTTGHNGGWPGRTRSRLARLAGVEGAT